MNAGAVMARRGKEDWQHLRTKARGPLQRLLDREQVELDQSVISVITPEQRAKGTYTDGRRIRHNGLLDKWFNEGHVGFHDGSRLAIEWCHRRWEARGVIGKQSANYEPTIGSGPASYERDIEMRDDLDDMKAHFHPTHWDVFEGVVRWGKPAGVAGSELADNPAQAIASARAVVGMIASFIATKKGY